MQYMGLGLELTLFGMGTVFIALGALALILQYTEKFLASRSKQDVPCVKKQEIRTKDEVTDAELVAILTSAVSMMMAKERGYVPNLKIISIKPASEAWRISGRTNLVS